MKQFRGNAFFLAKVPIDAIRRSFEVCVRVSRNDAAHKIIKSITNSQPAFVVFSLRLAR